jgi:hypothetical protein
LDANIIEALEGKIQGGEHAFSLHDKEFRALLVDPTARTVTAIELPLYEGDERCGDQIDLRDVKPIIGADYAEMSMKASAQDMAMQRDGVPWGGR